MVDERKDDVAGRMAMGMSLGIPFGVLLSLLADNWGLLGVGIALGAAFGALPRTKDDVPRTDRASGVVRAAPEQVYAALVDADALVQWLPPRGMVGRFERFDARPGGSYRLVLTHTDGGAGKSSSDSDVVEARFVELVDNERVVQAVDFVADDPAFAGTMTMTWELAPDPDGTLVSIVAEDVPSGISPEDHAAGMESSLANLAAHLER